MKEVVAWSGVWDRRTRGQVAVPREKRAEATVFMADGWPHRVHQHYQTFAPSFDRALYSSYVRLLFLGLMPDWERRGATFLAGQQTTYWIPK